MNPLNKLASGAVEYRLQYSPLLQAWQAHLLNRAGVTVEILYGFDTAREAGEGAREFIAMAKGETNAK